MSKGLKDAIQLIHTGGTSGQKIPALSLVEKNPELAAMISKAHAPKEDRNYGRDGNRTLETPNTAEFRQKSDSIVRKVSDSETSLQLLPDLDLGLQIFISSMLSPKDMMGTELTFIPPEGLMGPEASQAMISRVSKYFEQVYKIKPLLSDMLMDILGRTGSYAVAVLPENSIDELINRRQSVTMEALSDYVNPSTGAMHNTGILGPAYKVRPTPDRPATGGLSLETFKEPEVDKAFSNRMGLENAFEGKSIETHVTVTDNWNVLKVPLIRDVARADVVKDRLQEMGAVGMESRRRIRPGTHGTKKLNDRELEGLVYQNRFYGYEPMTIMKTQEQLSRYTVGNPLILHIPSEAVMPVFLPGNPQMQVGFFILLDHDGHPVSRDATRDHYSELGKRFQANNNFASAMLDKAKSIYTGFDCSNSQHLDYSARMYGQMIEQDWLARLRNGAYGNGFALAARPEFYRIMLARSLAKQQTQVLFLPVQMMTYIAFDYDGDGCGRSLLDEMKVLNGLRANLLIANTMTALKNSINRTEVKVKFDPEDPDPLKNMEIIQDLIVRSRGPAFPIGQNNPVEIADYLQRAGFEFIYEGHPGLPDMAIDFGEKSSQYQKVDTDLENELRAKTTMKLGLTPEMIDQAMQPEFAKTVVANNILFSKRVMTGQEKFLPQLNDVMRKAASASANLKRELSEIVKNHLGSVKTSELRHPDGELMDEEFLKAHKEDIIRIIVENFLAQFEANLPRPNSVTMENQLAALKTYEETLEETLRYVISDEFFTTETAGEVATNVGVIRALAKAHFMRQFMAENGIMPELADLTAQDDAGKPLINFYDQLRSHVESLTKTFTNLMVDLQPIKQASDAVLAGNDVDAGSSSSTDDSSSDDNDGGGSDDDTFEDPMAGGMPNFEAPTTEGGQENTDSEENEAPAAGSEGGGGEGGEAGTAPAAEPAA